MNKLIAIPFVVSDLTAPALSFAQSGAGLTRAQVVADLVRLEEAGYSPSGGDDSKYPVDIQAAEARVSAEDAVGMAADSGSSSRTTVRR